MKIPLITYMDILARELEESARQTAKDIEDDLSRARKDETNEEA
jgi:ribose 1,5-bisphosphokinase PhnN